MFTYTSHQITVFHILIYCFLSCHFFFLFFLQHVILRIVSATYALGIPAVIEVTEFLIREHLWFLQLPLVAKYCPSQFAARNFVKNTSVSTPDLEWHWKGNTPFLDRSWDLFGFLRGWRRWIRSKQRLTICE